MVFSCILDFVSSWSSWFLPNYYILFPHRASFVFQILHQSRIPILFSTFICFWTPIWPCPFQELKVTILGSISACPCIPGALVRPGPFQQSKVTIQDSIGACIFIFSGPFQQFKVTIVWSYTREWGSKYRNPHPLFRRGWFWWFSVHVHLGGGMFDDFIELPLLLVHVL